MSDHDPAPEPLRTVLDQLHKDARGDAYAVMSGGQCIGTVVGDDGGRHRYRVASAWYIAYAGAGVEFPLRQYDCREAAADALVQIRKDSPALQVDSTGLQRRDRDALDVAGWWFARAGSRAQTIRDLLGMTETHYYQRLWHLLDNPDAWAYAPTVVAMLNRRVAATGLMP